jgi:hypothetical protein
MANGPFGNPLSTGIALSFEVDMTPYREMHKRKLLAAKEKEEDQKKKQQQYADILKNITPPDASKIHKKYMPEVQNQYAELIDSAMGYINKNDVASLHKHMFEFDSNAKKAVQATENYKNYVNSDANKTFKSIEAIRSMEDDNTALSQIAKDYQNDVEYGDGYLFWSTIERPDLLGETNKILQGAEKTIVFDGGKPVVTGRMPETDEVIYQESVKDPDKVIDYLSGWLMSSPGGNRLLMDYGGINAGQLDERTPDGMQKRAALAREYVSKEIEPKLYGQKISKIKEGGGGFSFSMGSGKSEESIFNKSGGRELKIEGGNVLKTKGQYDITFTKGAGKTTMNVTDGSYEIDQNTGEFKKTNYSGSLSDAIPVAPIVDENGQEWYMAISQGDVADKDVNLATLLLAIRQDPDADTLSLVQKELAKAKYGKTYLIKGNDSVRNQFWGKILGQDYTKQRAADAMKELGVYGSGSSSNVTTQAEFDAAWAKLKPGEKLTSPDGTTVYTK